MRLFRYAQVFSASTTVTAPSNLAFAPEAYVWGESGTAGTSSHGVRSGAGSGGGAFGGERAWSGIVPGSVITVTVPQGSTGNPTTLAASGATTISAAAGLAPVTTTGGLGGAAGTSSLARAGGNGANSISGGSVDAGAGGGSAGSTGAGGSAVTSTGGTAGTGDPGPPSLAGVAGQNGPGALASGLNGVAPGGGASGGGGGGAINHTGGLGAPGQAILIWTVWISEGYSRGRPAITRGRSTSSPGAPVVITPGVTTPAPFTPPRRAPRGAPGAGRGRSASSAGSPVSPTPAPFTPPRRAPRGAPGARRGRGRSGSSSAGSPVSPTPAPFTPPRRAPRGAPGARRGSTRTGLSSPGAPVTAPPTPKTLLISLASAAGVDDYGTAYPQGILATAGVIQGPEFVGADFILNTSGFFLYSGTPAAGNMTHSVAPAAGVDQFGNNYVSGSASYQSSLASALTAGSFTTYTGSLFFGWTVKAVIETNGAGDLVLLAASGRQVITGNNILDGGGGGATFQADVSVNGANLNVGNGGSANVNLNPQMATPPNTAAVKAGTATLAQTEACLGALIQSMQNRGMVT